MVTRKAQTVQPEYSFGAELSTAKAAMEAQRVLLGNQDFDPREPCSALLKKMRLVMQEQMLDGYDDPAEVKRFLNIILATHPERLKEAQKAALAQNAEILEAEALPEILDASEPLRISRFNVYGRIPAGLNKWESDFAKLLDQNSNNIVQWWHRNEPRKPWSVNTLLPDGRGFYPDFIVGIEGRRKEHNALLADPKMNFERSDEAPKVLAEHRVYGRVLILRREGLRWMTVGWDDKAKRPVLEREFRLSDAAGF